MSQPTQDAATDSENPSAVAHLIELGYQDPLAASAARDAEATARQSLLANVQARLHAGDVEGAVAELAKLAEQFSDWPEPRRVLARLHFHRGEFAAASQVLEWLQLHGVEHPELSLLRARIALARRDFDAALDHAEYARFLHDPLPTADVILGEIHFRRGQLDEAEAAYHRTLAAGGDKPQALSGLAATRLRLRDYTASVDYALQALELNMTLPKTHYRLGLALIELARHAEAIAALETAARLNPTLAGPHRFLARAYAALNNPRAAEEHKQAGVAITHRRRLAGAVPAPR